MTAMMHGSRWLPKSNTSRNASSLEDDSRSTCSGTEPSDDERPSRTSSSHASVSGSTGLAKDEGQKWGRHLLGLLKTGERSKGEPPPPPPPPLPPKTKLHSGASLFIPKASVAQSQPWEAQAQAHSQGCSFTGASQCQSSSFDKEMLCWEYMHRGFCPRRSTCRWIHPPADPAVDNFSSWSSTFPSATPGAFVPQNTVVQAPYSAQPVFPQACSQVAYGTAQVNVIPIGSSCNFAPLQNQIAPSSCVPNFQNNLVPQTSECRIQPQAASSTGHPPLSLPLVDIHSQPCRQSGMSDLHDPDEDTPWPQFMQDTSLTNVISQEESRSETQVPAIAPPKRQMSKKSWADIQEDSDNDEPDLPQWQCRPSEDSND